MSIVFELSGTCLMCSKNDVCDHYKRIKRISDLLPKPEKKKKKVIPPAPTAIILGCPYHRQGGKINE